MCFCKFCGCPHLPRDQFATTQKLCGKNMLAAYSGGNVTTFTPSFVPFPFQQPQLALHHVVTGPNGIPTTISEMLQAPAVPPISRLAVSTELLRDGTAKFFHAQHEDAMPWIRSEMEFVGAEVSQAPPEQQQVVESMVFKAMAMFLRTIVSRARIVYEDQQDNRDAAVEKDYKVLVPLQVFQVRESTRERESTQERVREYQSNGTLA